MKKSLLAFAAAAMLAASAMAHGPPTTQEDLASAVVAKANATGISANPVNHDMAPPNERMLN